MYTISMKKIQLEYIIWRDGKHTTAQCLNVDVASFGKNKKEALANLTEALELYFEGKNPAEVQKITNVEVVRSSFTYA